MHWDASLYTPVPATELRKTGIDCLKWAGALLLVSGGSAPHAQQANSAGQPTQLAPVVVSAPKLAVERRIDRTLYDVTGDVQSSFGTAADLLGAIPSIDVDGDGVVSLRGDSHVLILIDGKPSALFLRRLCRREPAVASGEGHPPNRGPH